MHFAREHCFGCALAVRDCVDEYYSTAQKHSLAQRIWSSKTNKNTVIIYSSSFQTHKTSIHLQNTNKEIAQSIDMTDLI